MPGYLLWICTDLFLAFIPVALAFPLARGLGRDFRRARVRWALWLPLLAVWLLFLPNTCYLLTEWRHYLASIHAHDSYSAIYLYGQYPAGLTLSLLLLTSFYLVYTGAGLLAFFLAVRPLHHVAQTRWGRAAWPFPAAVCVLCALGVYLGLVNRFNSWDLIHPSLALTILSTATQTLTRPILLLLIVMFGGLLWLLYAGFDIWMDGLIVRRRSQPSETLPHASA